VNSQQNTAAKTRFYCVLLDKYFEAVLYDAVVLTKKKLFFFSPSTVVPFLFWFSTITQKKGNKVSQRRHFLDFYGLTPCFITEYTCQKCHLFLLNRSIHVQTVKFLLKSVNLCKCRAWCPDVLADLIQKV